MFSQELQLKDVVNLTEWQAIQDSFADVLEISLSTISLEGDLLTKPSRLSRICSKILPQSPIYPTFCGQCILRKDTEHLIDIDEETHFQCPFGLDVFAIPITAVGNRKVAYVVIGPLILNRRKDTAEYAEEAKRCGVNLDELMDALLEINVFSFNKIYSTNKMIKDIFSHMAQTGYHKKRLGEMAPELREMDPLFSHYYEEKILDSLLNACTLALDADSGSVMTLEKKTNTLNIKVASKLDRDVVNKTNIKLGDGIAGLAAATAKPILLPKDERKTGLSGRLKRDYIKSSMIVPFSKPFNKQSTGDVYGVINLNMTRKDKNFSDKDIAFVQEMINLVSVALIPIQKPS